MTSLVDNRPELKLEIAYGKNPLDVLVDSDWTDISEHLVSGTINEGRSHDTQTVRSSTMSVVLNDYERVFDPDNNALIKPLLHIRLKALWAGVWYNMYKGYITDISPLDNVKDNLQVTRVRLRCEDAFYVFNRIKLKSDWEYEVENTSPKIWYRLGEQSGSVMTDSGSKKFHGQYFEGSTFNTRASPIVDYDDNGMEFINNSNYGQVPQKHLQRPGESVTVIAWVQLKDIRGWPDTKTTGDTEEEKFFNIFLDYIPGSNATQLYLQATHDTLSSGQEVDNTSLDLIGSASGGRRAVFDVFQGEIDSYESDFKLVGFSYDKAGDTARVYRNQTVAKIDTTSPELTYTSATQVGGITIGAADRYDETFLAGFDFRYFTANHIVDEVIGWASYVPIATISTLYQAALSPWGTQLIETRFTEVLDRIGWHSSLRDLPTTTLSIGPMDSEDRTALSVLTGIAECFSNIFYMSRDGKVKLVYESSLYNDTFYTTPLYTFDDFNKDGLQITVDSNSFSDKYIFNNINVTAHNGAKITLIDNDSITSYGDKKMSLVSCGDHTDAEIIAKGQLARRKDPRAIFNITLLPERDPDVFWPIVLSAELSQTFEIKWQKTNFGSQSNKTMAIQRISHRFSPSDVWKVEYVLNDAIHTLYDFWVCGESKAGELIPGWPI